MPIVADSYQFVVGVDTHAATHSYAILACPAGVVIDTATFPTTSSGLSRAREWIGRRTRGDLDGVLIVAEGTGSYGAQMASELERVGYRVVEAPTPRRGRGGAKTDAIDAPAAARSSLSFELDRLRDRRSGDLHAALQVLAAAREQANAERLRAINALTALVRTHPLGLDARRPLTPVQVRTVAGWRIREESLPLRLARAEAVRAARRVLDLDEQLSVNRTQIAAIVADHAPALTALAGLPLRAAGWSQRGDRDRRERRSWPRLDG